MSDSVWYFPGDPPLLDLLLLLGLAVSVAAGVITLLFRAATKRWKRTFRACLLACGSGLLLALPGFVVVAHRHTAAWSETRREIRRVNSAIVGEASSGRTLTHEEFAALQTRHVPEPLPLHFPGTTEVAYLRMYRGVSPYVAVDFGHGAVAAFDPLTMLCVYAD